MRKLFDGLTKEEFRRKMLEVQKQRKIERAKKKDEEYEAYISSKMRRRK